MPGGRGGGFGFPSGRGGRAGLGVGGLLIMVVLVLVGQGLGGGGGGGIGLPGAVEQFPGADRGVGTAPPGIDPAADPDDELVDFTSAVFDDAQQFWQDQFRQSGTEYRLARIVLFDGPVPSGCGGARPEIGPHYCPPDEKVYLDLGFFRELSSRFGAPGDFAQAYVITHEVAHHVQNLLGTSDEVRQAQQDEPDKANEYSIALELQADCFSGVWAHSVFEAGDLEEGDLDEALGAAAAVGDDRLQREAQGRVDRESWTHGSSEQRRRWFDEGYDSGDPSACDTF
jgi:predicted metalloprotease